MEYRTLEINPQYAKNLNEDNVIQKMDVYAVVSISGGDVNSKQKRLTLVNQDGDVNSTSNFPIKFTVDEVALQMNRLTLKFKLKCKRPSGDKDVGEVRVPINELLDSAAYRGADRKQFVSYQVRRPTGIPNGQLTFSYKFSEKTTSTASAPPYEEANAAGSSWAHSAPLQGALAAEGYGYPVPPPGYGYPPTPPPVYGYPLRLGYGHPPPPPPRRNKFGVGLEAWLLVLGGALVGLLVGEMILVLMQLILIALDLILEIVVNISVLFILMLLFIFIVN